MEPSRNSSSIGQEHFMERQNRQSGFTLVELMVAMGVSSFLLAGMVMAFTGQSRSYNTQQEITVLQEDIRACLSMMTSEIRMAGYDPTTTADAKILLANATEFQFSLDITDDADTGPSDGDTGDANEIIRYKINTEGSLGRATGAGTLQPLAENTEQLSFEYLIKLVPETWTQTPTAADLEKIRAVKIVVLARTARQTSSTTDTSTFIPPIDGTPLDWTPATPGKYQRRMMSVVVQCRNIQG
jgi:type IV pilus assembly protein PilW